jgi:hypothetical protein
MMERCTFTVGGVAALVAPLAARTQQMGTLHGYGQYLLLILASLLLPEPPSLVYIGTLIISVESPEAWGHSLYVQDDYKRAAEDLRSKFPEARGETAKDLMHLERAR